MNLQLSTLKLLKVIQFSLSTVTYFSIFTVFAIFSKHVNVHIAVCLIFENNFNRGTKGFDTSIIYSL